MGVNKEEYKYKLQPFKFWTLQNFPFIESADFDSLTNYEIMCKIVDYLNKVIDNTNTSETNVENAVDYINNFFDNLDVQDEIDNKLDEMTEDGTLDNIINQQIFGELNDAVSTNTSNINTLHNQVLSLENDVSLMTDKKFVLIGDSYLEGYTPDGTVNSWGYYFKQYLGLNNSQVTTSYQGGASFAGSNPFSTLVSNLQTDEDVTDVIVGGGYNDRTFNRTQILTGMTTFKNACNQRFPNAKIYVAMIGWTSASDQLYNLYATANNYQNDASKIGMGFMSGTQYSLHDYFSMFSSDGIHPNQTGQETIAKNLVNAYLNGNATVFHFYKTSTFTPSGSCTGMNSGSSSIASQINNGLVTFSCQGVLDFAISLSSYTANGKNDIEVGTISAGFVVGNNFKTVTIPINMIVHDTTSGKYRKETGILIIRSGKIYLSFADVNDTGSNYLSLTNINQIQVTPFSHCFDSLFC